MLLMQLPASPSLHTKATIVGQTPLPRTIAMRNTVLGPLALVSHSLHLALPGILPRDLLPLATNLGHILPHDMVI